MTIFGAKLVGDNLIVEEVEVDRTTAATYILPDGLRPSLFRIRKRVPMAFIGQYVDSDGAAFGLTHDEAVLALREHLLSRVTEFARLVQLLTDEVRGKK